MAEEEPAKEEPKAEEEAPKEDEAADADVAEKEEQPAASEDAGKQEAEKPAEAEQPKEEAKEEKKEEAEPAKPPAEYQVYYWQGLGGGRAGVVRLCLALCQVEWEEANKGKDKASIAAAAGVKGAKNKGFPNFAYPILVHNKDGDTEHPVIVSQTAAICEYILSENGYEIEDRMDRIYALQTALTVWDAWSEFYGKMNHFLGFEKWIDSRIASYLDVLEAQLSRHKEGAEWFYAEKPSIADVFLVDLMRRYRNEKEQHYKDNKHKL
eukprot:CAMPEP_0197020498 /NCGR_PEP_ID=MMETSP1384-20130603/1299_1 /TAXON_ID=29189 /ORGANISM="Ammonia sp." /LENGTH=265 /DNA_ID=CAMNT_0042448135 /DNA_START=60 /DNA_END=854 /DNA_ORIENTATION=+